jgi:hypothetical protein
MFRFLPVIAILLITSCASNETSDSKNVKQSEIYQTYRIDWSNGSGSATASFRFGGENGTTLRLNDPSSVTYNGQKLTEGKFLFGGAFYEGDQANYSAKHVFRFTDSDGKIYENTFEFEPIEFKNSPKTVSRTADLVIPISRRIDKKEALSFVAQTDTSKETEVFIGTSADDQVYYNDSAQALIIKPGFFQSFTTNVPVTIWIEKYESKATLDQPTNLGGEFHFSYTSKKANVRRTGKR